MSGASDQLGMSDDDFLNQATPTASQEEPAAVAAAEEAAAVTLKADEEPAQTPTPAPSEAPANKQPEAAQDPNNAELEKPKTVVEQAAEKAAATAKPDGEKPTPSGSSEAKPDEGKKPENEQASEGAQTPPNYEDLYTKIMTPFMANGKKIELKDPAEAIQLMQMGANYTRKMQEMAPHRKIVTMLGNHGLLDESKLSLFIALDKGDPEAIKKFIMDKGIDPLDIDTKIQPAYEEGNYQVSDQELAFRTQVDSLGATEEGKQTLVTIQSDWDQASRDMLWQNPEAMAIIHAQRENGVYAKIAAEMDRQKVLGQLSPTTPFFQAYTTVGEQLHQAGKLAPSGNEGGEQPGSENAPKQPEGQASAQEPAVLKEPEVIVTRAAAPKPKVDNGGKAEAASPSRSGPGKVKETVNFLSMSDEDFLKASNLEGRV